MVKDDTRPDLDNTVLSTVTKLCSHIMTLGRILKSIKFRELQVWGTNITAEQEQLFSRDNRREGATV